MYPQTPPQHAHEACQDVLQGHRRQDSGEGHRRQGSGDPEGKGKWLASGSAWFQQAKRRVAQAAKETTTAIQAKIEDIDSRLTKGAPDCWLLVRLMRTGTVAGAVLCLCGTCVLLTGCQYRQRVPRHMHGGSACSAYVAFACLWPAGIHNIKAAAVHTSGT